MADVGKGYVASLRVIDRSLTETIGRHRLRRITVLRRKRRDDPQDEVASGRCRELVARAVHDSVLRRQIMKRITLPVVPAAAALSLGAGSRRTSDRTLSGAVISAFTDLNQVNPGRLARCRPARHLTYRG